MTRRKKTETQGPAQKRGAREFFTGDKLEFLNEQGRLNFQSSQDSGKIHLFYDKVTLDFVAKFGHLEDPPGHVPVGETAKSPEEIAQELAEKAAVKYTTLRDKLGQWYRRKFKRRDGVTVATPEVSDGNPFAASLGLGLAMTKRPRRVGVLNFYIRSYYKEHMKGEFERRFTVAKQAWEQLPETEQATAAKPAAVQIRTALAQEFWLLESQTTQEEIKKDAESDYQREVEDWEAVQKEPKTPQQFHQQMEFAPQYMRPILDALSFQMQAAVSICIIGPMADRNGEIEVRSVHTNWPGGLATSSWAQHDPIGYAAAEASMCAFGRANFSLAECRRRALPLEHQSVAASRATSVNPALGASAVSPSQCGRVTSNLRESSTGRFGSVSLTSVHSAAPPSRPLPLEHQSAATSRATSVNPALGASAVSPSRPHTPPAPPSRPHTPPTPPSRPCTPPASPSRPHTPPIPPLRPPTPAAPPSRPHTPPAPPSRPRTLPAPPSRPPLTQPPKLPAPSFLQAQERSVPTAPLPAFVPPWPSVFGAPPAAISRAFSAWPTIDASSITSAYPSLPWAEIGAPPVARQISASPSRPPSSSPLRPPSSPSPLFAAVAKIPERPKPKRRKAQLPPVASPVPPLSALASSLLTAHSAPVPAIHTDFPHLDPSAPAHMKAAHAFFTVDPANVIGRNWGPEWVNCVVQYTRFQRQSDFIDAGPAYPATKRPEEVTWWMKNHRRWAHVDIKNTPKFTGAWWHWWDYLQPAEQSRDPVTLRLPTPSADMDWRDLKKAGRNGLLLIMMVLTWWGKESRNSGDWKKAVNEVTEVMHCMIEVESDVGSDGGDRENGKRGREEEVGTSVRHKRIKNG